MLGRWLGCGALTLAAAIGAGAAHAQERYLVGLLDGPQILQPLGAGRALLCGSSCAVFSVADGAWTPTSSARFDLVSMATRLGDGSVLVLSSTNSVPPQLWNPATGTWRAVLAPPANLFDPRLSTTSDGRALIASLDAHSKHAELRVFVPDATGWKLLTRIEHDAEAMEMLVTRGKVTTLTRRDGKVEVDRYDPVLDRWQALAKLADPEAQLRSLGALWGMPVFSEPGKLPPKALLLAENGELVPLPLLAAKSSILLREIRTATEDAFAVVILDGKAYSWLGLDQPLVPLPPVLDAGRVVALDENHLLVSSDLAAWLVPLDGKPPSGQPCDGIERYVDQFASAAARGSYQLSVDNDGAPPILSEACREQTRQQRAPALLARLRLTARGQAGAARDLGRVLLCQLKDPAALSEIPEWFDAQSAHIPRVACLHALSGWPGAEAARSRVLDGSVYQRSGSFSVDAGLLRYLREKPPDRVLDELLPALRRAAKHHVRGFDDLRRGVCMNIRQASPARVKACNELAQDGEMYWNRERRGGGGTAVIVASTLFAGAISTAYLTRDSDTSRGIATGSGVLGGFTLGVALGGLVALRGGGGFSGKGSDGTGAAILGAGVLGAVAGGFGAYALARSSDARAPVTAGGLVLPYLVTLGFALE